MMSRKKTLHFPRLLLAALAVVIMLLTAAGTLAWLSYERTVQTVTTVQMPTLSLKGSSDNTLPIDIGEIDVSTAGSKASMFRVVSNPGTSYLVQLAHTTNIPFTYVIYPVFEEGANQITEDGTSYRYGTALRGDYLNRSDSIADSSLHSATYGSYANVQKNAEPLYWQSETQVSNESTGEDFYVLVVSWGNGMENDKETDMIYLTVGIVGAGV